MKALSPDWFPANFQAVIWRNWGMVPVKNIAAALECTETQVKQSAKMLGLEADITVNPMWQSRGYLTIIRVNWHISSYEQILKLLGIDEKELAFILKEDDFMWIKMGGFKPDVEDNLYRELTESEKSAAEKIPKFDGVDNSFDFLDKFYINNTAKTDITADKNGFRIAYSYFAVYGDPLLNEALDPYPEELLRQYAQAGVNGVWLQGILYQLADFKFDLSVSANREKRITNLNKP